VVQCLPNKHKALSSNLLLQKKVIQFRKHNAWGQTRLQLHLGTHWLLCLTLLSHPFYR
jgi:hypothetical protein